VSSGGGTNRGELRIDVSDAMPDGQRCEIAATVVAPDPPGLAREPIVVLAIPGGTFHRSYWDMHPPGRAGYSKAEFLAGLGVIVVAEDYLGGGDSSRPPDGDFITLEVQADAAHATFEEVRSRVDKGKLLPSLSPIAEARYVGIGQSLGGFITIIQQSKYCDYAAAGVFGATPRGLSHIGELPPRWQEMSTADRQQWALSNNARLSELDEVPMYARAVRNASRQRLYYAGEAEPDLMAYDDEVLHTLIPRMAAVDGTMPGLTQPFASSISAPLFLAFGEVDVSPDPWLEPSAYPSCDDITLVVMPRMGHMHNFAPTRHRLWQRFAGWLMAITELEPADT
jgi:pimeloyl-ACP methyl ester carboxylesterase